MRFRNSILALCLILTGVANLPRLASAQGLSAGMILSQAQKGNEEYFHVLRRSYGAIDITNGRGDTAYCMALKANDAKTLSFLAQHGANTQHSCVERWRAQRQRAQRKLEERESQEAAKASKPLYRDDGFFATDSHIWYTVGAVAAVGGAAAALSGGGGGSSSGGGGSSDDDDKPKKKDPVGELTEADPEDFQTEEYNTGNFLDVINAQKAYAKIFKKDEEGDMFGRQNGKDEALATVKVGIIDSGVYPNRDLKYKIAKTYDLNDFNSDGNLWAHLSSSDVESYVIKKGELYYLAQFYRDNGELRVAENKYKLGVAEADLENTMKSLWGLSMKDMALVNGGGGGSPGENLDAYLILPENGLTDIVTLVNIANYAQGTQHGTHVAGIIGADRDDSGMHGVAFENAELHVVSWDFDHAIYNTVKSMVSDDVKVFNNSWGSVELYATEIGDYLDNIYFKDIVDSYVHVAQNKGVWVQATGNDGASDGVLENGLGGVDLSGHGYSGPGEYEVPYVAVTALDQTQPTENAPSGIIAEFANKCGTSANYCIAAPGVLLKSTGATKSGNIYMSGTSMAAPVVSGSITLLMGYYPWLSAQNVAWLLLETANREGDYANSAIYGRGVLDLEVAVNRPIGDLSTGSTSDFSSLQSVRNSRIALGGPMQKSLMKAMPKTITAFDALHRPFAYDTANMMSATHGSNAAFRNKVSHAAMVKPRTTIKDEKSGYQFSRTESLNKRGQENLSEVEVIRETDSGTTRFYYAENSQYKSTEDVLTPTENPYFAMKESYGAENTMKLSDVSKLKLSLQTGENGLYERDYEQDRNSFDERAYAVGAEYSYNMTDYLELAAMGGMLYEEDAMLGLNGRGGLNIKDGSTYYAGIKAALNLTDNITILAAYYRGYTQGQDSSLLAISDLETESYMIAGEYRLNKTDKIGLSLSSPLSVRRGKATFNYATGRDRYSDTIYMNKLTSSLKPAAKEYDLGLYYQGRPKEDLGLMGKIEARFNADGEKGLTDYIGIIGAQYNFPH